LGTAAVLKLYLDPVILFFVCEKDQIIPSSIIKTTHHNCETDIPTPAAIKTGARNQSTVAFL